MLLLAVLTVGIMWFLVDLQKSRRQLEIDEMNDDLGDLIQEDEWNENV